jgi:hypothetical protein
MMCVNDVKDEFRRQADDLVWYGYDHAKLLLVHINPSLAAFFGRMERVDIAIIKVWVTTGYQSAS